MIERGVKGYGWSDSQGSLLGVQSVPYGELLLSKEPVRWRPGSRPTATAGTQDVTGSQQPNPLSHADEVYVDRRAFLQPLWSGTQPQSQQHAIGRLIANAGPSRSPERRHHPPHERPPARCIGDTEFGPMGDVIELVRAYESSREVVGGLVEPVIPAECVPPFVQ